MSQKIKEMRVFIDGDAWCFTLSDFENLEVSPSVWMDESDTDMDLIYGELEEMANPPEDEEDND